MIIVVMGIVVFIGTIISVILLSRGYKHPKIMIRFVSDSDK